MSKLLFLALMCLLHAASGTCQFSTSVCTECATNSSSSACLQAATEFVNSSNSTDAEAFEIHMACPFRASEASPAPVSPCEAASCVTVFDEVECTRVVNTYCTYQSVSHVLNAAFEADAACEGFFPWNCSAGEVLDCNNQCRSLSSLHNGVCNMEWDCELFQFDGGDCMTLSPSISNSPSTTPSTTPSATPSATSQSGECQFNVQVCSLCTQDASSSDCLDSAVDFVNENSGATNIFVGCPFDSSTSAGPTSPCSVPSCVETYDYTNCFAAVSDYCTYHVSCHMIDPSAFSFDNACTGFTAEGCSTGEVLDCNNQCRSLSSLHNGVCNTEWHCELFQFDGGDCTSSTPTPSATPTDTTTGDCGFSQQVCSLCAQDPSSTNCLNAAIDFVDDNPGADLYVSCPFASSSTAGPASPCSVSSCVETFDDTSCAAAVSEYCTYHVSRHTIDPSTFTFDNACANFVPQGCSTGEILDCNNQCRSLLSLHNGVCNTEWHCASFEYDGGDCDAVTPTPAVSPSNPINGDCGFSQQVCSLCTQDPSSTDCLNAAIDYVDDNPDADLHVGCPFGSSTSAGPTSPCSVPSCVETYDYANCFAAVSEYCTYHVSRHMIDPSTFSFDNACTGFTAEGCSTGEVLDCNNQCRSLSSLHNRVCNAEWDCELFQFDGGDCMTLSPSISNSPSATLYATPTRSPTTSHQSGATQVSSSASPSRSSTPSKSRSITPSSSPSPSSIRSKVECRASFGGLTSSDFERTEVRRAFRRTMARRGDVDEDDVQITRVQDTGTKARVVTKQVGVQVDFIVLVKETATTTEVQAVATSIANTTSVLTEFNTQLVAENSTSVVTSVEVTTEVIVIPSPSLTPSVSVTPSVSGESSSGKSDSGIGLVAGAAIGGAAGVAMIAAGVYMWRSKRKTDPPPVARAQSWMSDTNRLPRFPTTDPPSATPLSGLGL